MIYPAGTEKQVCEDIAKRQQFGLNKYGTSVAENPLSLREWLQHAYEESLDFPIYLKRAISQIEQNVGVDDLEQENRLLRARCDRQQKLIDLIVSRLEAACGATSMPPLVIRKLIEENS